VRSIEAGTDSGQRYSAHVCVNASSKRREDTHTHTLAASTCDDPQDPLVVAINLHAANDSLAAAHLLGQHAFGSYGLVTPCPLAQLADSPDVKHDSSSTLASACFRPLCMMS
jgi:hypothetical protein